MRIKDIRRFSATIVVLVMLITTVGFVVKPKTDESYSRELPILLLQKVKDLYPINDIYSNIPMDEESAVDIDEDKKETKEVITMPEYDIELSKELQEFTWKLCLENNISYEMILSLLYLESRFETDIIHINKDSSRDLGISQWNENYIDYHAKLLGYDEIDPFNPKQSIEATVKLLVYYRDYWKSKGVTSDEDMFPVLTNTYNMGVSGVRKYIRNTGNISRKYDRIILRRKLQLEEHGRFID